MHRAYRWGPFFAAMSGGKGGPGVGWEFDLGSRKGRRRRRMFGSGELRLLLLALIAGEQKHGYELIKEISELTHGAYEPSPGTVYPTLALLEDEGAIAQAAGDETRKAYEATAAGMEEVEARASEITALFERLSGHAEHRRAFATPEMFRALGNLAGVLKNRARSGKLDEETMREIVDLVDELAKKIERL